MLDLAVPPPANRAICPLMNLLRLSFCLLLISRLTPAAGVVAITDNTNYNVGTVVSLRLEPARKATVTIRYAGEDQPVASALPVSGSDYAPLWTVPWNARTGRYLVDLTSSGGATVRGVASFAVHRQLAKVESVELDKTFYTSGDSVNPRIVVRNLSNQPLENLRVEFEAYTYPWIAPSPDETPAWRTIVADRLSLPAQSLKEFRLDKAAVVQAGKQPVAIYYSVVIRDSRQLDRIYDLAFAPPAFTIPPNTPEPKQYPFLYLYQHAGDVPKSEAYRRFYPPEFVSDVIAFDTSHTMFGVGAQPTFHFTVATTEGVLSARVLSAAGTPVDVTQHLDASGSPRRLVIEPLPTGLYTLEVKIAKNGIPIARNRLEFAVNPLPKSILIFCAHQDDDTAHPALIREAVENHIPIHVVYFTGGDAGGCDRYYMHSCDAARAMDFGEVRMEEARASLGHLGVPRENIEFLGLPDGGMEQIWYDHTTAADPYLSVLLASDHSPYRAAAIPNLPFARDPVVAAARDYIARYQPDLILTGHPDERHVDHRTNNWIVVDAMQQLLRDGKLSRNTKLLVDISYGAMPGRHSPYKFEKDKLHVPGEAARWGRNRSGTTSRRTAIISRPT